MGRVVRGDFLEEVTPELSLRDRIEAGSVKAGSMGKRKGGNNHRSRMGVPSEEQPSLGKGLCWTLVSYTCPDAETVTCAKREHKGKLRRLCYQTFLQPAPRVCRLPQPKNALCGIQKPFQIINLVNLKHFAMGGNLF